jgi:uncharacterized cupredoxin-like copper-binding protein
VNASLKKVLILLAAVTLLYGGFVGFASANNGHKVEVTFHLGTKDGKMYLRCARISGATCTSSNQTTVTVGKRDRVTFHVHNDDGGDHSHDFKLGGWQYALPPISPETELHTTDESWTFTAWAPGSFSLWCEINGHAAAGMKGKFIVE